MNQRRVQILLEPRQHQALQKVARQARKSLSELMREMADRYLEENTPEQVDETLLALDAFRRIRGRQAVYNGNPVAEARAERERQVDEGRRAWLSS